MREVFAKKSQVMCLLALALQSSGCASLISGSKQDVTIESQPAASEVQIFQGKLLASTDGKVQSEGVLTYTGRTPAQVGLKREHEHTVVVKAAGFQEVRVLVDRSFNGWVLGNLLCGLLELCHPAVRCRRTRRCSPMSARRCTQ
jgi:hypothetical protein